ncbi:hypothetical protein R3Q06_34450 [Rhodococcus erythropolis]|uniref:hypothetical protein n=1 Tax=Rhodococcus erythropolis TaxID=1833 RepID=UPI0029498E22|nr:hypothetical protein [Rhodococcus erythropolis]MDV6278506.1 hypothetical protein [Rhodococcus erythropolis]
MLATARISQKMAGAAGETAEHARYFQLTRQGLNNSEICRQLGIGRKTGCTWRNGHSTRDPSGARRYHSPIAEGPGVGGLGEVSLRGRTSAHRRQCCAFVGLRGLALPSSCC